MKKNRIIFAVVIVTVAIVFILMSAFRNANHAVNWNDLNGDGVKLFRSVISPEKRRRWREMCEKHQYKEVKSEMHNDEDIRRVVRAISPEHVLHDYIMVIEKSAVHTCHRDNNGTFFNAGQKYPSYTMLVYLEPMNKCLGVIPGSHTSQYKDAVNFKGGVTDIGCSEGDIIIFDANLVHAGAFAEKDDNLRIQMKISHPDDLTVLAYYQDYNKVLNKKNTNPLILRQIQRGASCAFPFVADLTQKETVKSVRGSAEGTEISTGQKWFSWLFYGRTDFYDLPNAF